MTAGEGRNGRDKNGKGAREKNEGKRGRDRRREDEKGASLGDLVGEASLRLAPILSAICKL